MKKIILLVFTFTGTLFVFIGCSKDGDLSYLQKGNYESPGSNLNTVQLDSFNITTSQWTKLVSDTIVWVAHDTLSTAENMDGGVFLFVKEGSDWSAIPHVESGIQTNFGFNSTSRSIELHVYSADDTVHTIANPGNMFIKVVTIPARMCRSNPSTNFQNYKSIKATFDLKN